MQTANVGPHAGASGHNLAHMILNVSAKSLPPISRAAQCWDVAEVGMRLLDREKFIAVIESVFVTGAIDQPELMALVAFGLFKQPVHDPTKRGDSSAGGDEHRIVMRLAQREHPVRSVKLDDRPFLQIA